MTLHQTALALAKWELRKEARKRNGKAYREQPVDLELFAQALVMRNRNLFLERAARVPR